MQVFQAVKNEMGDDYRPQHFAIEQAPETEEKLVARNAYLLKFGITAIWFEKGYYDYVENILRLARNELRYRGNVPNVKKVHVEKEPLIETQNHGLLSKLLNWLKDRAKMRP